MKIEHELPLLDELLESWKPVLGADFLPYRNHLYRMVHFCLALKPCDEEEKSKIMIAACFHDLGIWTHDTWDYLPPSAKLASEYLTDCGREDWIPEVVAMIEMHHKITSASDSPFPLVEIFRLADLIDVSLGRLKCGLPSMTVRSIRANFPNAGFHRKLMQLSLKQLTKDPLHLMPMMRW